MAYDWPNWSGETLVVVGTGPSARHAQLGIAKGRARVFVIKSTWKLAPFADALYGIDKGWWIANLGCPKFTGLKFTPSPTAARAFGLRQVKLKARADILIRETGVIGCGLKTGGGHSGFQAINLGVQFGARRILMVGFDMTLANGAHWNDDYNGVAKPDAGRVAAWREAMDDCADQFRELGIDVVNCSLGSALKAYPKLSLREALA